MDNHHEENYKGIVDSGAYTLKALRAMAVEREDTDLVAWCDAQPERIETATKAAPETATLPKASRE